MAAQARVVHRGRGRAVVSGHRGVAVDQRGVGALVVVAAAAGVTTTTETLDVDVVRAAVGFAEAIDLQVVGVAGGEAGDREVGEEARAFVFRAAQLDEGTAAAVVDGEEAVVGGSHTTLGRDADGVARRNEGVPEGSHDLGAGAAEVAAQAGIVDVRGRVGVVTDDRGVAVERDGARAVVVDGGAAGAGAIAVIAHAPMGGPLRPRRARPDLLFEILDLSSDRVDAALDEHEVTLFEHELERRLLALGAANELDDHLLSDILEADGSVASEGRRGELAVGRAHAVVVDG